MPQLAQRVCRSSSRRLVRRSTNCCWLIIYTWHYCFSTARLDGYTPPARLGLCKQQIRAVSVPVHAAVVAAAAAASGSSIVTLIIRNHPTHGCSLAAAGSGSTGISALLAAVAQGHQCPQRH
jgi:hypothetical protein